MHPALQPPPALPPFMVASHCPPPGLGITPEIDAYYKAVQQAQEAEKSRALRRAQHANTDEARVMFDNCSSQTLRRYRKKGLIRSYRAPGTLLHYYLVGELEDVKALMIRPTDGRLKGFRRTSNPPHQTQKGAPANG